MAIPGARGGAEAAPHPTIVKSHAKSPRSPNLKPSRCFLHRRVERLLRRMPGMDRVSVLPLHGNLAPELQDLAIRGGGRGGPGGIRRVILSTPIAESSVTIDGVRSGQMHSISNSKCVTPHK